MLPPNNNGESRDSVLGLGGLQANFKSPTSARTDGAD